MTEAGCEPAVAQYRLPGAIDLIVCPTRRFRTTLVDVVFHRPLDEKTARAALLPYLLRRGTRTFPDMVAVERHLEKLFGASLDVDVLRYAERQAISFRLDVVDDRFLFMGGRGLLRQGLRLLREVILQPALREGRFPMEPFEQERLNLLRFVEGLSSDKGRHALDRCVRHMCEGEPYARSVYGEPEEIAALTSEEMHECWRDVLEHCPMDVYVVGSAEPEAVREMVSELFSNVRSGRGIREGGPATFRRAKRIRRVREEEDVVQARLVMGFRTGIRPGTPDAAPFAVWNTIFGDGSFSRLFREVRERHSLAYYCSSSADLGKGVIFVQAGIDAEAAGRVERLVRRQMGELARGRMDLSELRAAKAYLRSRLSAVMDSPARIVGFLQDRRMAGSSLGLDGLLDRVIRVRRDEVSRVGRMIEPDTYYLLAKGER